LKTDPKKTLPPRKKLPKGPAGVAPEFPIVGVGASAGGLEAFTQLLEHLPVDTGLGFVLVQHLDPQHPSALAKILQQATTMPVRDVTNNLRVEPNHIYIIPPNKTLGIVRGTLKLQPRSAHRIAPRAIDHFLEALAKDQQERAIGVILSGTATDGTLGLEAIKAEGGLTFAQDRTARYDSMPRSAADAGCVDFVLSPAGIAHELAQIARHPSVKAPARARGQSWNERAGGLDEKSADGPEPTGYRKVLQLLRNHSGVDFSLYKYATIHRRITRRMVLNRQDSQGDYANFLRGNPKELEALYSDALISVTSFFRNAEAFEVLKRKVFAPLLKQRSDDPVRVWVLGCSTGQEAYSLAMAYAEVAEKIPRARKLSVFATDLKDANLEQARHGLYAKGLVADVSPERLRRFFSAQDGGYRVIKSLRQQVVFARHNLISDPPFSRMDLISCRNLMIYLEPSLQKKALPAFHYALKPEGVLFLGASESVGGFAELFNPLDKRQKIFARKTAPTLAFHLPVRERAPGRRPKSSLRVMPALPLRPDGAGESFRGELNAQREADRVILNQFAPPGVLIDEEMQILQFRGSTGAFLEPPTGKARFDLLKMAREGLMLPLRTAISRAKKENTVVRKENVPVLLNGRTRPVNLEVVPLKNLKERRFLILFEGAENPPQSVQPPEAAPSTHPVGQQAVSHRIVSLEQDLAETRDYLETIQEQQEAANEELQSANEEGQSANEELQSLNEELETSKEELESTNEELTTVNEEMTHRNLDLNRLNGDLTNLQTSTNLAILLLGRDLTIRRFTLQAEKQFNLRAGDVGRPLSDVRHNLLLPNLDAIITRVITTVREYEHEVQSANGHWYSLRLRPYLTIDNRVDGAVLVLVDITELKKTQHLVTEAHEHAAAIIRTVHDPLVILNSSLRLQSANEAFYRTFRLSLGEAQDRSLFELDHGAWNIPRLRVMLSNVLSRHSFFDDFEVTHTFAKLGRRSLVLNARRLNEEGGHAKQILLGIRDVTELLAFEADLRRSEIRYRRLFEAAKDGILILDPVTRKITDANPFIVKLLGYSRSQLIKKELWQIGLLKDEAANRKAFRDLKAKGFIRYEDLPLKSKDGTHRDVEFVSNLYDEDGSTVIQCNIRDITERKQAQDALVESEARYRALFDLGPVGVYTCDAKGMIKEFNRRAVELWGRTPKLGDAGERYCGCGSCRRYRSAGNYLPNDACPVVAVLNGTVPEARNVEVVIERRKGSQITAIANFVPLRNVRGEITGAINSFFDITERKQAEEALRQARTLLAEHADHLEGLVAKRTVQLTKTNRHLAASVQSIRQGREQIQALFLESQGMQKRLRHVTRQILSAQEDERKKISRDLHDDVVQTLVAINVELAVLASVAREHAPRLTGKIAHTQRLVEGSVTAIHRFARELRPAVLDDLGLIPALHAFSKGLAARHKFKIHLTAFAGVESLDEAKRTVLFRVAQEALSNIARHACATQVDVKISHAGAWVQMAISDNGQSFPVEKILNAKNPKRLGLVGMKERIEMVGGSLTIESTAGRGTTVHAAIPYATKREKITK